MQLLFFAFFPHLGDIGGEQIFKRLQSNLGSITIALEDPGLLARTEGMSAQTLNVHPQTPVTVIHDVCARSGHIF